MSQIYVEHELKLRTDSGVLLATNGPVTTVPYGAANGVATLDSTGKIPAAQDLAYVFTQTTPASVWVINHNLGKFASVNIVDSANDEVIGEVHYNSINQITITFSAAFSGMAYLN
jgi:hypothetical protein